MGVQRKSVTFQKKSWVFHKSSSFFRKRRGCSPKILPFTAGVVPCTDCGCTGTNRPCHCGFWTIQKLSLACDLGIRLQPGGNTLSHLTFDSNPLHLLSTMGCEPVDKLRDVPIASTEPDPVINPNGQNLTDRFEQARKDFFSTVSR